MKKKNGELERLFKVGDCVLLRNEDTSSSTKWLNHGTITAVLNESRMFKVQYYGPIVIILELLLISRQIKRKANQEKRLSIQET